MPGQNYSILNNRAVLTVSGEDRVSFLQGMVSNDVERVSPTKAIWAAFLTPQGKFLHEFMIARVADHLVLDCEANRRDDLLIRLNRFRMRSKVDLAIDDTLSVAAAWGDVDGSAFGITDEPGDAAQIADGVIFRDPRLKEAGVRLIAPPDSITRTLEHAGYAAVPNADYDAHRISLGLPDGSRDLEIEKALLLENGFEELGGVDFEKGCYIGQELTARTHYRALIKKRLLPVSIEGSAAEPGTPLMLGDKEAGEMKTSSGTHGLALVRLAQWRASDTGTLSAGSSMVRPEPPNWMTLPQDTES